MGEAYIIRRGSGGATDLQLYESGVFDAKVAHSKVVKPSGASVTYATSYISMTSVADAASEMYVCFGPVNLARYSRLVVELENPTTRNIKGCAFAAESGGVYKASAVASAQKDMDAGVSTTVALDLSEIKLTNGYVYAGFNTGGEAWSYARSGLRVTSVKLGV